MLSYTASSLPLGSYFKNHLHFQNQPPQLHLLFADHKSGFSSYAAVLFFLSILFFYIYNQNGRKEATFLLEKTFNRPPIVHIPRDIQLSAAGHAAYNAALDTHGDVVIIPRHGRMEYVIDHRHVRDVLTDANHYSFEKAVTNMLHMEFLLWFRKGTYVQELNTLVQEGITPQLTKVIDRISGIFASEADKIADQIVGKETVEIDNMYEWVHHSIAQAMVALVIGEQHLTPELTQTFMDIVTAITNLSGIHENTRGWKYFPHLWSLKSTLVAIFGTIVPKFFFRVLPRLWKDRHTNLDDIDNLEQFTFLNLQLAKYRHRITGHVNFIDFIWSAIICLGIIFASIHQTAVVTVWCIFILSQKQHKYLAEIRQEMKDNLGDEEGNPCLSLESLRSLTKLDSFIREVMRCKGDTFAPVRYTTKDVQIGQYIIPKNSLCAPFVKRVHEHQDNYGSEGCTFHGFQWHEKGKPAVQGNHDFISFGLGRWACPGRHLAIGEIKLILVNLFLRFDVHLKDGKITMPDPMNATSVAPEAVVIISRIKTD